jgi:hypothetical protein
MKLQHLKDRRKFVFISSSMSNMTEDTRPGVADGHLTYTPLHSVYSGVVSIRGFRIVMFLAELSHLDLWATDVGNAYLEPTTTERVYIVAGPEFAEREGHTLVIRKALYGLTPSGQRWHDNLHDCMVDLGFMTYKAEPDVWMKQNGKIWEYVAVYVDDLAIAMKDPKFLFSALTSSPYNFELKGSGPIKFHLGMEFSRDNNNVLCLESNRYLDKMISTYERHFGEKPRHTYHSPLEKGDHPEMDTTELLDSEKTS